MKWRSIKTAPKDGTEVLLFCNLGRGNTELAIARWHEDQARPGPFGRFCWKEKEGSAWAENIPTHWMPLPAAPRSVPL